MNQFQTSLPLALTVLNDLSSKTFPTYFLLLSWAYIQSFPSLMSAYSFPLL